MLGGRRTSSSCSSCGSRMDFARAGFGSTRTLEHGGQVLHRLADRLASLPVRRELRDELSYVGSGDLVDRTGSENGQDAPERDEVRTRVDSETSTRLARD